MKVALTLLVLFFASIAEAQVYKCKSSKGIEYSDLPCATSTESTLVHTKSLDSRGLGSTGGGSYDAYQNALSTGLKCGYGYEHSFDNAKVLSDIIYISDNKLSEKSRREIEISKGSLACAKKKRDEDMKVIDKKHQKNIEQVGK